MFALQCWVSICLYELYSCKLIYELYKVSMKTVSADALVPKGHQTTTRCVLGVRINDLIMFSLLFYVHIFRTDEMIFQNGYRYLMQFQGTFGLNSLWPSDVIWRQRSGSILTRLMACCLAAPSHYLNQCWLIISEVQWHSYPFENYISKFTFKFPRGQWVKSAHWYQNPVYRNIIDVT